jgi:phosphopantothenoylcysteine synthetase/decarboxylase
LKTVLVGITGAVAAFAIPSYVLQIRKALQVRVVIMLSKNASKFVTPYALQIYSGEKVYTDTFDSSNEVLVPHIRLTKEADLMLIMPASANILAKAANGICDDLISTSIVAAKIPVIFAPSMNGDMWDDTSVKQNVARLVQMNYTVIDPVAGFEVDGISDTFGVMPGADTIIAVIERVLNRES